MPEEFADHYDILGLGRERYKATEKQIKDNYKILSLKMHPDKCGVAQATEEEKEAIEQRFKALQLAFEAGTIIHHSAHVFGRTHHIWSDIRSDTPRTCSYSLGIEA